MARVNREERARTSAASRSANQSDSNSPMEIYNLQLFTIENLQRASLCKLSIVNCKLRERLRHSAARTFPRRQPVTHAARSLLQPLASVNVADDLRERRRQSVYVSRRHEKPGLIADELPNRTGVCADNRQSTGERFGDRHAVAFIQRRQDENIGAIV